MATRTPIALSGRWSLSQRSRSATSGRTSRSSGRRRALVFVAAGVLVAARVFDQVKRAFGDLRGGIYVDTPLPPLAFSAAHLVTQDRKLPTNYYEGAFVGPRWSDPDFVTAMVAVSGLSSRLFDEVRSKRNLTYAVHAEDNDNLSNPIVLLTVSAVDPNTTAKVMFDQVKRLGDEPMAPEELAGFKSVFLTRYLEEHETPAGQAWSLGSALMYGGDWRIARTIPDRVKNTTAADIQAFAKKRMVRVQSAVVGDPAKVDTALFTSL